MPDNKEDLPELPPHGSRSEPAVCPVRATDAEYAAYLKKEMAARLQPVLTLMNEATVHGIDVQFTLGKNFAGLNDISALHVLKRL